MALVATAIGLLVLLATGAYLTLRRSPAAQIATVEVLDAPANLEVGGRAALTGRVKSSTGANIESAAIAWSTSDSSIATVSGDGTLTAVAAGSVTVTASCNGKSASARITVSPGIADVSALEVQPRKARIASGATVQLSSVAKDKNGKVVTGRAVEWTSLAPQVAPVSQAGLVSGLAAGTAVVTATSGGKSASAVIIVAPPAAASLDVRPASLSLAIRQTARLTVMATDAKGKAMAASRVAWTTSAPAVAAISPTGVVTGVGPGTARIVASSHGLFSAPVNVTVIGAAPPPPTAPPAPGVVQVLVVPWALLSVDGRSKRQLVRETDTLSAGVPHRLHFERDGFATIDTVVTLRPGEARQLRIQMTPRKP